MRRCLFIIAGLAGLVLSMSAIGCSSCGCQGTEKVKKAVPDKPKIVYISKADLQKMMKEHKNLVVIDVLSAKSFSAGHIKGAISIPLDKIETPAVMKTLDKNKPYVVYCASTKCHASTKAAEILMKHGFKKVYDYKGGLAEWKSAKLPLETAKLCKCGAVKGSPSCCK